MGEGATLFGAGADAAAYAGFVINAETPDDYKGNATSVGATLSIFDKGVTVAYFWSSGEAPFTPGNTQGFMLGYAPGAAASVWFSQAVYNPTWTSR